MNQVFKYTIPIENNFSLVLPQNAKILTVDTQYGKPQIWVMVNANNTAETRNFLLVDTGGSIKEDFEQLDYIGTFQLDDGSSVGHLFELK